MFSLIGWIGELLQATPGSEKTNEASTPQDNLSSDVNEASTPHGSLTESFSSDGSESAVSLEDKIQTNCRFSGETHDPVTTAGQEGNFHENEDEFEKSQRGAITKSSDYNQPQNVGSCGNVDELVKNESAQFDSSACSARGCDGDVNNHRTETTEHRIFVGNISYRVNWKQLSEFFSKFGTVRFSQIIMERAKHRSKGYGFVAFESVEERDSVLTADADDLLLDGRLLRVFPAEQKRRVTAPKETLWTPQSSWETDISHYTGECYIDLLPDDCLRLVILKLPFKQRIVIERVCKKWREVALSTWCSLERLHFKGFFSSFGGLTDKTLLSILAHRGCRNLKTLDLSDSPRLLTDWAVDIVGKNCSDLRSLNLSNVRATNVSLKTLGKMCSKLENISLKSCHDVGEKGLWWLFHRCKNLKYVDLSLLKKLSGKCFHMLGANIQTAILNESELIDGGLELLCTRSTHLTELWINKCHRITGVGICTLSQVKQSLKDLHAENLPSVTDEGWRTLKLLHNLTELHVRESPGITDDVLVMVGKGCRLLQYLDISGCSREITSAGISGLDSCIHLEVLRMSYLDEVDDTTLRCVAVSFPLKTLECRYCPLISDAGLTFLAIQCITLQEVDVSSCIKVTNLAVDEFARARPLHGTDQPLELIVGGTCIENYDEDKLTGSKIKLDYSDLCGHEFRSRNCFHYVDYGDDDVDDEEDSITTEGSLSFNDMEEAWTAAGNEEYDADWSESHHASNDWQEAWLEADDPVYEDYWNPS